MSYEDLDLRPPADNPPPSGPRPSQAGPRVLAALLVAAVAITGYFVFRSPGVSEPVEPPAAPTASTAALPAEPQAADLGVEDAPIDVPPLDESDPLVRELGRKLSSHPSVVAWLASDNLIRTFTVVVSNIARGEPASGHVPALRPRSAFSVQDRDEELHIDPRSYARYTPLATAASSIDPEGAARLYATLKPRIEEAYRDLGYPDTPFDATLERALVRLLRTPVPSGPVPLQPTGAVAYRFADPTLEALTPTQKLLIRFGPDNARAVQASLRAIALALGIPPERLP